VAKRKHLEAEAWCPRCKSFVGKIFLVEEREGCFVTQTEPKKFPTRCNVCEGVIERKR